MKFSRSVVQAALLLTTVLAIGATPAMAEAARTPADVFDQLRMLEGSWTVKAEQVSGEPHEEEAALESRFEFKVSGGGSVVMESMNAGTPHEMINMYHMDGDELVLTHYCAAGNQPTMKLDREALAEGRANFVFTGGTNLDPAVDEHIHSAELSWQEDGSLSADWTGWAGGKEAAVMHFDLTRSE